MTPASLYIGDRVRSYDWDGDQSCFVEGSIVGFSDLDGCKRYKIWVERKVWAGEEVPDPLRCHVYPPINGTLKLFGGVCNGVERIR